MRWRILAQSRSGKRPALPAHKVAQDESGRGLSTKRGDQKVYKKQIQQRSVFVTLALFCALAAGASLVLTSRARAQSSRAWSSAGSTGTIDEDSAAISQVRNFTVTLLPGATGSVHIRYNITPTNGISSFCPATTSQIKVRFRNSDNSGATARVSFDIHSTNVLSGTDNIIYSFNSDAKGAVGSFTTFTDSAAPIDFDFAQNVYWLNATIFKSDFNQFADLGSILISETAGTACP